MPPRSRLESTLVHLWNEALELDELGLDDDFFALGGDSLAAVRMLADVEDIFLAHVPFGDFLEAPTVAGLVAAIGRARGATGARAAPAPEVAANAPCTFAQERLWFLDQAGAGAAYNLPLGARIRGALDAPALVRGLEEVVRRHAALRTTIGVEDATPVQVVAPGLSVELPLRDLRDHPEREAEALRRAEALVATPFELDSGPLFRGELLQLADDEHVLVLAFHHIVCDGWSHAVIFRELGALYRAFAGGEDPKLPEPAVQYPDFARAQRQTPESAAHRAWWLERLAGSPAALELPTDRPRPPVLSQQGTTRRWRLAAATSAGVRELARATGATTFATLLAAYAALLSRQSRQETVMIGTTTSGRDRRELESGVGFFANTVALRAELGGSPTFSELIGRMRDTVREAVVHQDVPFESLVADLEVERDASRHPVFQVFFAQTPAALLDLEGAAAYPIMVPGARFEIVLSVEEEPDGLTLVWEYSTDLFDEATVERWHGQYVHLLDAAIADPGAPVAGLPLMDERDRRAVIASAAAVAPGRPVACVHELFAAQAARTPDAPAVVHEGVMLSYRMLDERANQLAHRLRGLGVGRESLVALCLERSLDIVVAALGVLKAGGAYVPMDPGNPTERLGLVLEDTGAPVVLTQERLRDRLPGDAAATVLCMDDESSGLASEPLTAPDPIGDPGDLAYVIYTSGSTGKPKGVLVEHRNVARLFSSTAEWFGFGASDTWVLLHSYAFDFSVWEMWGALLHGGKLVIPSHWTVRSPEALARLLTFERVTVLNATPSLFAGVMDELLAVADHLALRVVIFGGEALRPAALRRWFERLGDDGPTLVNMYGITETTVHVTYLPIGAEAVEAGGSPIGLPLPDLELHVLDPLGEPVPDGIPGEIHVGGAGVARGYLNRPELTAERFVPNPYGEGRLYRSGDLARRLPGRGLDFLGRGDAQVKVRGYRIELGEIESALLADDGVSEAAVAAVEVGEGDTRLAAYVVAGDTHADADELTRALRSRLERQLPAHMVPASLVVVDALALTTNGKLDRGALPPPAWEEAAAAEHVAPRTATETMVAEVWQEVLGIDRVGAEDSFFALGGHSLLAARIATKVRDLFAIELSVRTIFDHPTLAAFAAVVDAGRAPQAPASVTGAGGPGDETGDRHPLAFPQQQLLFFDVLRPGLPVYNAALAVDVEGPLDVDALRRALDGVIERHEPLRTVFLWEDEHPRQVVLTTWTSELPVVDLGDLEGPAQESELRRLEREHARRPFDLAGDLMLRATVFRLGEERHMVLLQPHHIAVDGWSVDVLFSELSELYEAARTDRAPALAPLGRRYVDFVRWQRERVAGERREQDVAYWRTQLAGARQLPPLRTDRPRPPEQTFEGRNLPFALPARLAEAVMDLARAHEVTPYMVLLAAFGTLLHRAGGSDDVLVGTPSANRGSAEFEPLVGFFTNTLVLRLRLDGNPRFADVLDRVRTTVLEAFDHQELPFEQVVDAVGGPRDPATNPLFQVNFRARVGPPPELALGGATTRWTMPDLGISRFDLALEVHVREHGLEGYFEYNTDLFAPATIEALALDFEALLEHVVAAADTRVLAIPLRAAAERAAPDADIRSFRRRRGSLPAS